MENGYSFNFMHNLETIYRFLDTIAAIVRNINPLSKKIYFIGFYIKNYFIKPSEKVDFMDRKIYFDNSNSLLSGLTEIFFNKSYDFDTNSDSPVIIDCGANIGLTAIYFKDKYPNAKITCLEPVPQTYKLLKKNLKGFTNLTILFAGANNFVSGKNIFIPINEYADSLNYSTYKNRWSKNAKYKTLKVKTIKISSLINDNVDCLILDIEGNENLILKDLNKSKKLKLIRNIFVEFHNYNNSSLVKIIDILKENNFELIIGSGVRPPYKNYKYKFWSLPIYAYQK